MLFLKSPLLTFNLILITDSGVAKPNVIHLLDRKRSDNICTSLFLFIFFFFFANSFQQLC